MSFLPLLSRPQRLYENILAFRTLTTYIRTWVERDKSGPDDQEDFASLNAFVQDHRSVIDNQPMIATAELLTKNFPRICAVEVMNGSRTNGVIIYPRWT